jgi:hypothetical protein
MAKPFASTAQSGWRRSKGVFFGGATVVEIDEQSIEAPFWLPRDKKKVIVGRPGTTQQIDFPVYNTGEVEGVGLSDDGAGNTHEMGGVEVQLTGPEGEAIATTHTAHDGFYLFTLVKPGPYTVQIPKVGARQRDFLVGPSDQFRISADGEVINGIDFLVRTKTDRALRRERDLRHQLDEEQALVQDALERLPSIVPRRSDPGERVPLAPIPVSVPESPPAPAAAPSPSAGGAPTSGLHFASYRSRKTVEAGWNDVRQQHQDLIGSFGHNISEVDLGAERGVYFRLSALSTQEPAAARSLCAQLQQRNQYCAISTVSN